MCRLSGYPWGNFTRLLQRTFSPSLKVSEARVWVYTMNMLHFFFETEVILTFLNLHPVKPKKSYMNRQICTFLTSDSADSF